MLQRLTVGNVGLDRRAEAICDAAQRGAQLTRQLLAFSRRQELSPEAVDVNGVGARGAGVGGYGSVRL